MEGTESMNRAQRRAAGVRKSTRIWTSRQRLEVSSIDAVAAAVAKGLSELIRGGADPLTHSSVIIGTDYPGEPGALIVEVRSDMAQR